MNPNIEPLVAPNAVKNCSLNQVKNFLFPQVKLLPLQPTGIFGIATNSQSTGSGPGGSFTEAEMTALGLLPDDLVYLQYQLGGTGSLYDANDDIRIFQGYVGDTQTTPSNSTYTARVILYYQDNFQAASDVAMSALLNISGVSQAIQTAFTAAVTPVTPTAAPSFVLAGPVSPDVNDSLQALVSINGQAAQSIAIIIATGQAYNSSGVNITSPLVSQGVNVQALLSAMQAALPPGS